MKWKIILIVAILLLILAQALFRPKSDATARPSAPDTVETASGAADLEIAVVPETPPPAPDAVVAIAIGDNDDVIRLSRDDNGWSLPNHNDAPADNAAVTRMLHTLLTELHRPLPPDNAAVTGLEDGHGLPVRLQLDNGDSYAVTVGLRPPGVYDAAYIRLPDGRTRILAGDLRGDLGLWRNTPEARPEPATWLDARALSFDPARAVRIEADFPDHHAVFEKSPEGAWQPGDYVPGDKWNADGLAAWLKDLSGFRVADVIPDGQFPDNAGDAVQRITVTLDDGAAKTIAVLPNHEGAGMLAVTSDRPGLAFHLPEWRYRRYLRLLPMVFPGAAPNFDVSAIRFIDIRKGGESVKIARRDDGWEAVALPYPLKTAAVERLAGMAAAWRPEDYAAPDFRTIRPGFGGPMLEIILEDGTVHQYRLAGRHPLFPWRYVTLDGRMIFSVADAEAALLFPGFADILDMGFVFRDVQKEDIDAMEASDADATPFLAFNRNDDGNWSVRVQDGEAVPMPDGDERILDNLLRLRVTGLYDADRHPDKETQCHVRLSGKNGLDRRVTFLQPEDRDIPYLTGGNRGYLANRADFQSWIASARELEYRLLEAARTAEDAGEVEEAAEAPVADIADENAAPDSPADDAPDAAEAGTRGHDPDYSKLPE